MTNKTKECDVCHERKPVLTTGFYTMSDTTCIVCKGEQKAAVAKRQMKERKVARLIKKKRKVARNKTKDVVRQFNFKKGVRKKSRKKIAKAKRDATTPAEKDAMHKIKIAANAEQKRQEQIQVELAKRELAKRDLLSFIKYFDPNYIAGWVHEDICHRLEQFVLDVLAGKSPHLMLFMPPRHGKSMIVSENLPAWVFGNHPSFEFISTSYSGSLANQFSRRVQEKLRDPGYKNIFPGVGLSSQNQSIENWGIAKRGKDTRGGFLAAGVGGPITGRGANIFLIDDPVKNREEAESQIIREANKRWYTSTAYTRLMPNSGMLIVMTRWHDDDLAGWQLHEMEEAQEKYEETGEWPADSPKWEVVSYPAEATHDEKYRKAGEALHEARFPLARLRKIKKVVFPRDWSALYQQTPTVETGSYFKEAQIRYYTGTAPLGRLDVYCAGDLAISKKETADWSVFMVVGLDEFDNIWVLDERRGRWDANEIVSEMFDIQAVWHPKHFGVEKGQISMAIGPLLSKRIQEERRYEVITEELLPGKRDKEVRARPIQGRIAQGKVKWPQDALWVPKHVNELLRFPSGVNDDRVDAMAWIGQMLVQRTFSGPKSGAHRKSKESWKDRLKDFVTGSGGDRPGPMAA